MAKRSVEALNKNIQNKICEYIYAGNNIGASAQAAGITHQTLNNWLRKGKKQKEGKYYDFFHAFKKAEADAEVIAVSIIRKAMIKTWQAAAWWLERKHPKNWAKHEYSISEKSANKIFTLENASNEIKEEIFKLIDRESS